MDPVSGPPSGPYASLKQRALDGGGQQSDAVGDAAVNETGRAAQTGAASAASVLNPSRIKDRIDALIDNHIAAGQITDDQASVLRQTLSAAETRATDISESAGASALSDVSTDKDNRTREATAAHDVRPSPSDTLASFIQHVQRSQSRTIGYGSDGARSSNLTSSRLLDFNT